MLWWTGNNRRVSDSTACLLISCSDACGPFVQKAPSGWDKVIRVRSYGQVVPAYAEAPQPIHGFIAHAVEEQGVRDIVLCGHTQCEALRHLLMPVDLVQDEERRRWSRYASRTRAVLREHYLGLDGEALWEAAVQEHVLSQLEQLLTHPAVSAAVRQGRLGLQAWIHDERKDALLAYDPKTRQFETSVGSSDPHTGGLPPLGGFPR